MTKSRFALYSHDWLDDYYRSTTFVKRTTWFHEFMYYFNIVLHYMLIGIESFILVLYKSFTIFIYFFNTIIIKPLISSGLNYDKKFKTFVEKTIVKCMHVVDTANNYDYPEDPRI